jgi:thioredoxin 1
MNPIPGPARIVEIGAANFEAEVLKAQQPVLAAFSAAWSRPCHVLDAVLEEVASACAAQVKVVRINADDNPDLSLLYDIQSIPTLLYFVAGHLHAKVVGTASKAAILSKLELVCGADAKSATPKPNPDEAHKF